MPKTLKIFIFVVLVIGAGLATRHYLINPAMESPVLSTDALFSTQFPDVDGKVQNLGQWRGKILVVNFWASWCVPCREEMPELSELQERYRSNNLVMLGISTDDLSKMQAFNKEVPVKYPILAGDYEAIKLSELLGNNKGVLPYTLIIDTNGKIVKTYFGRINQALLEEAFAPLFPK